MKKENLRVGIDGFAVSVVVSIPTTLPECQAVAKGNADYVVAKFVRGYRIDLQEGGARQVVREMVEAAKRPVSVLLKDEAFMKKVQAAVAEEIGHFDSNAPRSRGGRPAKPVVLTAADMATLAKAKDQPAAIAELLAAKGIRLEIQKV